MANPSHQLSYRADIDGLRAVAVLGVVFCHVGLGFPGGYVGVDVFFVISGYLITCTILKEIEQGTFSILNFWERRIRRILPALLAVTLVSLIAGYYLLLPPASASLGLSVINLDLLVSNIHFWRDTGYFRAEARERPLLHTWSLAVEEQFYLFLPVFLLLASRVRRLHRVYTLLALAALMSFALSVYGSIHYSSTTFYLLPTRAWELLVGALIAIRPAGRLAASPRRRELAGALGLAAILIPCLLYDEGTRFPGLAALPPVLGAALLITAGIESGRLPSTNRLLARRPLVFVGLISYSLYLWHWPLIAFAQSQVLLAIDYGGRLLLVAGSMLLGILSWRYVEIPVRSRKLLATRSSLFAATGLAFLGLLGAGSMLYFSNGFVRHLAPETLLFVVTSRMDDRYRRNLDRKDVPENLTPLGGPDGTTTLLVWGDSHAMSILPAIDSLCREAGVTARAATHTNRAPAIDYYKFEQFGSRGRSDPFNVSVLDYIKTSGIGTVVLAARWSHYFPDARFPGALLRTIDAIQAAGSAVYFMNDVPEYRFNVPNALGLYSQRGWDLSRLALPRGEYDSRNQFQAHFLPKLRARGVQILDPVPILHARSKSDDILPFDSLGSFYRDREHLSTHGALTLKPLFARLIGPSPRSETWPRSDVTLNRSAPRIGPRP